MLAESYSSPLGFAGLLLGSLLVALDAVALAPALPTIEDSLNATTIQTYWAGVAYTVGAASFLPLFPAASNAVGRRPASLVALTLFFIGTVISGSAPNIEALLAGRAIQGIGGGGNIAMMYAVISDLFELRRRSTALAINGVVWLAGLGVGPCMGGGFSTHATWRWIFFIALPINGLAIVLVALFLEIPRQTTMKQDPEKAILEPRSILSALSWRELDYMGAVLVVVGLCTFLIPIMWAGTLYAWSSWHTLVPLILGLFTTTAFLVYEAYIPRNPVLPLSIFNNRTATLSYIQTFVMGIIHFSLVFYVPQYYQLVREYSPLISGVAILPETLLAGIATIGTGIVIQRLGRYKMSIAVGWVVTGLGCGLIILMGTTTSPTEWVFLNFPAGLGLGILFLATTISAQANVDEKHAPIATGLIAGIRAVGQAVGIAVSNTIVLNITRRKLEHAASPILRRNALLIASNFASPKIVASLLDDSAAAKEELLNAALESLRVVWWLLVALCGVCFVSTALMHDVSLERKPADEESVLSEHPPSDQAPSAAGEDDRGRSGSEAGLVRG